MIRIVGATAILMCTSPMLLSIESYKATHGNTVLRDSLSFLRDRKPSSINMMFELAPADAIKWREYLDGKIEAEKKARPIIMLAGKKNDVHTNVFVRRMFANKRIAKWCEEVGVPIYLEGPKDSILIDRLGITKFPTVILADPDGRIYSWLYGIQSADELEKKLRAIWP